MSLAQPIFTNCLDYNTAVHEMAKNIGWDFASINGMVLDENQEPMPWYNYSMVAFLKEKLRSDMEIFEFGSGFSTLFYAKHCKCVTSVEISQDCKLWVENSGQTLGLQNFQVHQVQSHTMAGSIENFAQKFDIIVVDSADRLTCSKNSISHLKPNGVVIFDNSEREKYAIIYDIMQGSGFKFLNFTGIKPLSTTISRTTIFYQENNVFGI